jgi:hypothetical protein
MGEQAGFSVEPVHLVSDQWEHKIVSSTRIRGLIAKGELAEARGLLDRPHEVRGLVVAGGRVEVADPPESDEVAQKTVRNPLLIEVPGEILLPPPGEYSGSALEGTKESAVRIVVLGRLGRGVQQLEISGGDPVATEQLPFVGAPGDVLRVRFG